MTTDIKVLNGSPGVYNAGGGYDKALALAASHYENFPVISFLIDEELRKHIAIIYWFARTADDIADEGTHPDDVKIERLLEFRDRLTYLLKGDYKSDLEAAITATIKEKNLTAALFYDLLTAFCQDILKKRYHDFEELEIYCSLSANPIGRLILELHDIRNEAAFLLSDKVCTALQLINFYQDTAIDFEKGRIYYPLDEMLRFGVTESMFDLKENNLNLEKLVNYNLDLAEKLLMEGKALLKYLPFKLRVEIKWTILGGREIITKIRKNKYNVFVRPTLSKADFIKLLIRSII